jgi:hypothetical protein
MDEGEFPVKVNNLMGSASIGGMTAAERQMGRYMRAPDGHEGDGGGAGGAGGGSGGGGTGTGTIDLPDTLDTLDTLPAKLRPLYIKDDVTGKFNLDDVGSLRNAVGHIKNENKSLKGKMSQFKELENLGLSPDQIKQMAADRQSAEEKRLKDEGDFNALKQQLEENFNKEKNGWQGREQKLVGTISKILVDDAARAVLTDPSVDGNPTLLLPLIRDRVKVTETDDGFGLQVLRPDGAPMLNPQNEPATLKDLFLEMKAKPEYAGAFRGVNQSGSGAPNGQGGDGGAIGSKKRSEMSTPEKVAFIAKNGQDAYFKLPA